MNELQVEAGRVLAELKECCRLVDLMWTEENPGAMVESTDSYLKEEVNDVNFGVDFHRTVVDMRNILFL